MSRLIESIKVKNGQLYNLDYHLERIQESCLSLFGSKTHPIDFELLREKSLELSEDQLYKLKIIYDKDECDYNFVPYYINNIQSLQIIEDPILNYEHKFENRKRLKNNFNCRNSADDIIITRHGALTDSYYCNIALGTRGDWHTPDQPLLKGTKRKYLLDQGIIKETEIYVEDIPEFELVCLFNAMIDFGEIVFSARQIIIDQA